MLIAGDQPGASMPSMAVEPGRQFGTSNLNISVPESKRYGGYVSFDNQGSRYTGTARMGAGAQVNSLLGMGDSL
jgi:hemolysin activation/secretion protein